MTYNKLVNQGVLKNKKIDPDHIYEMKPGDDKKAIMKQLRLTTPMNQNQGLRLRKDGQVRRVYKGGRKTPRAGLAPCGVLKPKPREPHDKLRLRDTQEWTNSKTFKHFSKVPKPRGIPADTETDTDDILTRIDAETPPDITETDNIFEENTT